MDCCKYVNVFHGCGEISPKKPEGIAAKWFFIKAGCGNTTPAATVPFGAVSVGPYSGGYPTGYGDHLPNSFARPQKFSDGKKLYGFAHLHQSGTGAIGYYYNYALVTPSYDDSPVLRTPTDEFGQPGYYAATLEDIRCELTSTGRCAYHRYTFPSKPGRLRIDFSNNGLRIPGVPSGSAEVRWIKNADPFTVLAQIRLEGIDLIFAVRSNCSLSILAHTAETEKKSGEVLLRVALSPVSVENALSHLSERSFDEVKKASYDLWNQCLSSISIESGDEEVKSIFYSNLYHTFVKPSDWSGDCFLDPSQKSFVADLNTLWDMYKTQLPLLLLVNREMGEKTVETLLFLGEKLGTLPISIGISEDYLNHSNQARMLAEYVLFTALRYGYKTDKLRLKHVIESDVFAEDKTDFLNGEKCRSNTFLLDMADCCALAAEFAMEAGFDDLYRKLTPLAARWKDAYAESTGLLRDDGEYYEGTLYNYSFRQMVHMDERIRLAGGNEKFVRLLDRFFGYGEKDVELPTDPKDYAPVAEGMKLGRFEGFNNESDTEAPFSYIYAGRHDRTCEILRAGMEYMFTYGPGGIPGNNDSGALSSYYVFAAIGLYPVAGQDLFLLGSPFVDSAEIKLFNGNILKIIVDHNSKKNIYVKSAVFNGTPLPDYRISAERISGGGVLCFEMTDKKNSKENK